MARATRDQERRAAVAPRRPIRSAHADARPIAFVSVVLPCLNEEAAVATTVAEAFRGLAEAGVAGEVIVVDNGSLDRSAERAGAAGARVLEQTARGYGAALRTGIAAARGDVVVIADADRSYDVARLGDLLIPIRRGADLVVGARLRGKIDGGAMPILHRYLGTPALSGLVSVLAGVRFADGQSGYRAFRREAVVGLGLGATGMEYASEMLLKAAAAGLRIAEVPTRYRVRVGESKLRPIRDGWRHLRLLARLGPQRAVVTPVVAARLVGLLLGTVSLLAGRRRGGE
jgi:glycosyltransferase involved in cell wall biosynthesis